MFQNAPYCTIQKNFGEACPRTSPSKRMATPRVVSHPPPQKKISCPPLANPAYAHELLLINLFENLPLQTVDCV